MLDVALDHCRSVFDLVIPLRCALCRRYGADVCADCSERLCAAAPLCRAGSAGAPKILALGQYAGTLRAAVLALKFRHRIQAARMLGALLGTQLTSSCAVDAIVPVPLHAERLRSRGFNQAQAIAQGVASVIQAEVRSDALVRTRPTDAQSSLALGERRRNVNGAFAAGPSAARLRQRHVMIVDDVVTTGATVAACAMALHDAGIEKITVAALAIRL